MSLDAGARLGPYELGEPLGAGGMGEVHRGRDTRLNRPVAIKFLKTEYSHRFEREAKAISALNHPHICTLYDVGVHEGEPYLVMELVEGKALSSPLPVTDAVRYALQIADALGAAHRAGVVHSDLKPANIIVTKGGIKILDFGIARTQSDVLPVDIGAARTQTAIYPDVVVGTPQYMAPEQLQHREVDARTDIFAFGLVLYEMLAGRRAYDEPTVAEVVAAIIREPAPSVLDAVPDVPPLLDRIIRKCLEKNPDRRWQSMEAVSDALEWALEAQAFAVPAPPKRRLRWSSALALAALVSAASIGATWAGARVWLRSTPEKRALSDIDFPAYVTVNFDTMLALSPDGRFLVFNSVGVLWLRSMEDGMLRALNGTEDGFLPFWAPDSRTFGFFAHGKLKRMTLPDGAASVLADAPNPRGGAWSSRGTIVFAPAVGTLMSVAADGGTPVQVTGLDPSRQEDAHSAPSFLPDGDRFLFFARSRQAAQSSIKVGSVAGPPSPGRLIAPRPFESGGVFHRTADGAYLLFLKDRDLVAQRFDPESTTLEGAPTVVVRRVRALQDYGLANFSVARDGALVFAALLIRRNQPIWIRRDGHRLGTAGEADNYESIRLSRDARNLATGKVSGDAAGIGIWIRDLERNTEFKLPLSGPANIGPWAPDGRRMAIGWQPGGREQVSVYVADLRSLDEPEPVLKSPGISWPLDWSRDGRFLLYAQIDPVTKFDIWAASMTGDGVPFPVIRGPGKDNEARFSPDGRFVAYQTDEGSETRVYVTAFQAPYRLRQVVSEGSGSEPRWRADGRELYYISLDRNLMAVPIRSDSNGITSGRPVRLFGGKFSDLPIWHFEPNPTGDRFLVLTLSEAGDATPAHLLTGWQADVK
jgi:serine/threonine protein kinase/Tol biopolymer transport system component